jgi:hypothetical protein
MVPLYKLEDGSHLPQEMRGDMQGQHLHGSLQGMARQGVLLWPSFLKWRENLSHDIFKKLGHSGIP